MSADQWVERSFTVCLNEGKYGSSPDAEEIAYLLRMGGIEAEPAQVPTAGQVAYHVLQDGGDVATLVDGVWAADEPLTDLIRRGVIWWDDPSRLQPKIRLFDAGEVTTYGTTP